MSGSDIVKQGYVKVKSKHLGKWSKRWLALRSSVTSGSSTAPARLEKYRDETAFQTRSILPTVFILNQFDYVARLRDASTRRIYLVFADYTSLQFEADSDMETENWLRAIKQLDSTGRNDRNRQKSEMYEVYLTRSCYVTSHGECLLEVEPESVRLLDLDDPRRVLLSWTLTSIRKYSIERGMFVVETGRASSTGEGVFVFDCKDPEAVYDAVERAARALTASARHKPQRDASSAVTGKPIKVSHSTMTSPTVATQHKYSDSSKLKQAGTQKGGVPYAEAAAAAAVAVDRDWQDRREYAAIQKTLQKPATKLAAENHGTAAETEVHSPTYVEMANDEQDKELTAALRDACHRLGLQSLIVDKIQLL